MLPKFSIAFSFRTMTPRLAIICAPCASVMLMAGRSSGVRPTARANANSKESSAGLARIN